MIMGFVVSTSMGQPTKYTKKTLCLITGERSGERTGLRANEYFFSFVRKTEPLSHRDHHLLYGMPGTDHPTIGITDNSTPECIALAQEPDFIRRAKVFFGMTQSGFPRIDIDDCAVSHSYQVYMIGPSS